MVQRHFSVALVITLLTALALSAAQEKLTNADVIRMVHGGLSPEVIEQKIQSSATDFHTDTADLLELAAAKVPASVIKLMLASQGAARQQPTVEQSPAASANVAAFTSECALFTTGRDEYLGTLRVDDNGITFCCKYDRGAGIMGARCGVSFTIAASSISSQWLLGANWHVVDVSNTDYYFWAPSSGIPNCSDYCQRLYSKCQMSDEKALTVFDAAFERLKVANQSISSTRLPYGTRADKKASEATINGLSKSWNRPHFSQPFVCDEAGTPHEWKSNR